MYVMTHDHNDECINVYRKQKAHAIRVGLVLPEVNIELMAN